VRILGALWETSIYGDRAPDGKALIRVMIGGATDPDVVDLSDGAMLAAVRDDLERTMGVRLAPEFVHIVRHRRGIPQYTIGHLGRLDRIQSGLAAAPGLFLAGNSYRGVSVNSCIEEARKLAVRIGTHLRAVERGGPFALAR
jgi:oxygen-dependent protoporphyrinogen oxidase